MLTVVVPLVLLANGLAAGVLLGTQLGGFPLLAALPADRYVQAHAFFSTRYDPVMPICFGVTIVGCLVGAVIAEHTGVRVLLAAAALAALATVTISFAKNVPVNKWVRTLDPDNLPADFARVDPRRHWGFWNSVRTALATLALVANCGALALLL